MASQPGQPRGHRAASGVPVKPDEGVPLAWLNEAGSDLADLADHVDRLTADVDLITSLALGGYTGPEWAYFSNELARYGIAVLRAWMHRGLILEKCKSRGFGGLPQINRPFTHEEVDGLVNETIAAALKHFRTDVLMRNRWDSRKGASLRTFFIGQCLIRFNNIYRRWWGEEERNGHHHTTDDQDLLDGRLAGPEAIALDGVTAAQLLAEVRNPQVRRAFQMTADGWPQAEIARALGKTEKAVERMLANERARIRKKRGVA